MQAKTAGSMEQAVPGQLSEDCLFLNLTTPSVDGAHRPVLVWIHGGGFASGSANEYDGRVLSRQGDAVVVTINYRLGAFGFLDLAPLGPEFAGSASNGYRDMILALQWVSENIEDFGGDPTNVTIIGESAGAKAVLGLLAAPQAEGLFHKAIANSPGAPRAPEGNQIPTIAEKLGVDEDEVLAALRRMSAADLQKAELPAGGRIDGTVVTRPPNRGHRCARWAGCASHRGHEPQRRNALHATRQPRRGHEPATKSGMSARPRTCSAIAIRRRISPG